MELPPGWRGYGARDAIEHPATALRQAEIEAIRAAWARRPPCRAAGADAHRHLLPPHLRGLNARIGEER
jgi:fumarate reductase flavoprotein subunit